MSSNQMKRKYFLLFEAAFELTDKRSEELICVKSFMNRVQMVLLPGVHNIATSHITSVPGEKLDQQVKS